MNEEIYKAPESNIDTGVVTQKASTSLKIISFCLAAALMVFGAIQQFIASGGRIPESIGGAVGGVFWPLIVVALFQMGKGFRNQKSRYKVFMWTASIVLALLLLSFVGMLVSTVAG